MNRIGSLIGIMVVISGLGHIIMAITFDNPSMTGEMIIAGILYLILGYKASKNRMTAIGLSSIIMVLASVGSYLTISEVGYPENILKMFLLINMSVVITSIFYFANIIRTRTN